MRCTSAYGGRIPEPVTPTAQSHTQLDVHCQTSEPDKAIVIYFDHDKVSQAK